jgi:catechol 2,3-dioxygenase-like lactoylglutathione lyase family enzyme
VLEPKHKEKQTMSASQEHQPTLVKIAPRFAVGDLEQTLAFYGQLGFVLTDQWGEGFAIIARDGISLHFTVSDGHAVCWIGVTNSEALYQQYVPTGAIQSPLTSQPWGMKEFFLCDPFRNLLLFGESIPEEEASAKPAG